MAKKQLIMTVLKKVFLALVVVLFFGLMAVAPSIGYAIKTHVYSIDKHYELYGTSDYIFAVVSFNSTACFNPILYPISWLINRGQISGNFSMIYLPFWTTPSTKLGERYIAPRWGKQEVIEREASMKIVIEEFLNNMPILPAIFFIVELSEKRMLYWWFLGGTVGFVFGALIGVIAGFSLTAFFTGFIWSKLKNLLSKRKLKHEAIVSFQSTYD